MGVKVYEKRIRDKKTGEWVGSGKFRAVAVSKGERRYSDLFPSKREADKHATQWRAALAAQHGHFASKVVAPTLAEYVAQWVKQAALDRRASTIENYEQFLASYLLPVFGDKPVTALTPKALREWVTTVRAPGGSVRWKDRGLSTGTLRIGLAVLRQILDDVVADGHLPSGNPLAVIRAAVGKRVEKDADPFDPAELHALFAAADTVDDTGAWGTWLRMWAGCGARRGETQAWRWDALDLDAGTIAMSQTFSRGRLGEPKTKGSARTPSFLHPVSEASDAWRPSESAEGASLLVRVKRLKLASAGPFVFGGTEPAVWKAVRWRKTLKAAEVRYRCPETLRHSCASILLSRGAPLLYVQKVGGWKSAGVLLRVYARWVEQSSAVVASAPPVRPESDRATGILSK